MNVNFAANSHPAPPTAAAAAAVQQDDKSNDVDDSQVVLVDEQEDEVPLVVLAPSLTNTAPDRRAIIIHQGILTLNPAIYKADRLYQAFLMYNHKIVLCECFSNSTLFNHVLQHLIHAWSTALQVQFIQEDAFMIQTSAPLHHVAQATTHWLAGFVQMNTVARMIQSGQAKLPSHGLAAPTNSNNHNMDVWSPPGTTMIVGSSNNSKQRRFPSKAAKPAAGKQRKATMGSTTTKTKSVVSVKKPQSKHPRKRTPSKKGKGETASDAASLPMQGQLEAAGSVNPSTETTGDVDATLLLEPLDKNDFDSHNKDTIMDNMPDDYLEFLLPEYATTSSLATGDGGDFSTALSLPVASRNVNEEEEEEEKATGMMTSTTTADDHELLLHEEEDDATITTDLFLLDQLPISATAEDVDAFFSKQMPLLMTSEDSSDSSSVAVDELLNME